MCEHNPFLFIYFTAFYYILPCRFVPSRAQPTQANRFITRDILQSRARIMPSDKGPIADQAARFFTFALSRALIGPRSASQD